MRQVLVVHEQHPQALGCDRRLLSLVRLLQLQGRQVSMLYRRDAPLSQQSPRTPVLAEQLGVRNFVAEEVHSCLKAPPALYRYVAPRQLHRLAAQGWFDLVLLTVWFWNDPAPSFAEIFLPAFRAHAPAGRQVAPSPPPTSGNRARAAFPTARPSALLTGSAPSPCSRL